MVQRMQGVRGRLAGRLPGLFHGVTTLRKRAWRPKAVTAAPQDAGPATD